MKGACRNSVIYIRITPSAQAATRAEVFKERRFVRSRVVCYMRESVASQFHAKYTGTHRPVPVRLRPGEATLLRQRTFIYSDIPVGK
jgi:hypothetical protein